MLIDKGYYDYDFERAKANKAQLLWEDTVKNETETRKLLARFGIGKPKEQSVEDLQKYVMSENSKTQ